MKPSERIIQIIEEMRSSYPLQAAFTEDIKSIAIIQYLDEVSDGKTK